MGTAINIQKMAPPITSDAVTGAASAMMWLTLSRLYQEWPRSWW
jgi:hypothetical protein